MKDTRYYDQESSRYSQKRYPAKAINYVQSFYLRRLRFTLDWIAREKQGSGMSLIEIGCADGVVINKLYDVFQDRFSDVSAVDISSGMIEAARAHAKDRRITFSLRSEHSYKERYDAIIEIGVINYADAAEELAFARSKMNEHSIYICSIAGTNSLWHKKSMRKGEDVGFNDFRSYAEYEQNIRQHFTIANVMPVGLFIPYIWHMPAVARIVQSVLETLLAPIAPMLFHEKLYLLKIKN